MTATFTWTVNQMTVIPQIEGKTDVVIEAAWTCQGVQYAPGSDIRANAMNTTQFTLDSGSAFTPYTDLTQDQVLGWIWASGVDKQEIEDKVQAALTAEANRSQTSPPLPWIQPINPVV